MNKFRDIMRDSTFIRASVFILFNAIILCIFFFLTKNIGSIWDGTLKVIHSLIDALWPLIIGLILAYLMNPLSELIDAKVIARLIPKTDNPDKADKREHLSHFISVLLTIIIVIACVIALIYGFTVMIMGKFIFSDISALMANFMDAIRTYEGAFNDWVANNIPKGALSDKLQSVATMVMEWFKDNFSVSAIIATFTNIGGSIVDVVIGIIISIYLMKDKKYFLGLWHKFLSLTLPHRGGDIISETLSEVNDVLSKFIRGALLDALIIAILSSIGLSIMGLQAAIFIGVFAGICNIIPYFGPVLGMIPAFIMGLFGGGIWQGVLAVVILLVIQQIDANFIYPKIVGSSTGLHPLMVLLAISVFGYYGGILGMLIAVPIAGVIQVFVLKWVSHREKKLAEDTENP